MYHKAKKNIINLTACDMDVMVLPNDHNHYDDKRKKVERIHLSFCKCWPIHFICYVCKLYVYLDKIKYCLNQHVVTTSVQFDRSDFLLSGLHKSYVVGSYENRLGNIYQQH